jgi:hypothetical protein
VKIMNQITAATAQPLCMPPMWYTWAQMRRIRSGNQVGTEEKTIKRRLMTGSERIRTATQRFAAVASAIEGSGYSSYLTFRYTIPQATPTFTATIARRNQR